MQQAIQFVADHWQIPAVIGGVLLFAFVGYLVSRSRNQVTTRVDVESAFGGEKK